MSDLSSLTKQLENAQKLLENLEIQAARFTDASRPAHLILELEDQKKKVDGLRQQIEKNGKSILPFTNRFKELDTILSEYAPAYYLIDGPAGYGKTELLKEIQRRFKEKKWHCAYVLAHQASTLSELLSALAVEFGIEKQMDRAEGLLIHRFSSALPDFWEKSPAEGLVILIDLDKKPAMQLVESVLQDFIPFIQASLQLLNFFRAHHNRFRVIFAGRYMAMRPEIRKSKVPLEILRLSPFRDDVVADATRKFLPALDEKVSAPLAAHIFFATGGHPQCVAKVLEKYQTMRGFTPDAFFSFAGTDIWDQIVYPIVSELREGLEASTRQLYKVMSPLSTFRYVDYEILRQLAEKFKLEGMDSEYDLADELTSTYLLDWKGRVLRDDLSRRLLAIAAARETPVEFKNNCRQAMAICKEHLQRNDIQRPEIWLIEYLFQFLQQNFNEIDSPEVRHTLRMQFLKETVPQGLMALVENRNVSSRGAHVEQTALSQALEEDWEFRFTVNYYLRSEQIEQPYKELTTTIDEWFNAKFGNRS